MLRLITFKKKLAELLQKEDTIAAVTLTQFIEDQPHYLQTCQKDMNVDRSLLGKDSILFQKQLELEKEMKSQDIAKSDAETKANHRALLNEKFRASLKQHQAEQPDKFWSELPGLAGKIRSYFNVAQKSTVPRATLLEHLCTTSLHQPLRQTVDEQLNVLLTECPKWISAFNIGQSDEAIPWLRLSTDTAVYLSACKHIVELGKKKKV